MILTDAELDEFIAIIKEEDGTSLSRDEAREPATRVVMLYRWLMQPTPRDIEAARLAKSGERGKLSDESTPHKPNPLQ